MNESLMKLSIPISNLDYDDEPLSKTDRPMLTLDEPTTQKYMTFTNFNYRQTYRQSKRPVRKTKSSTGNKMDASLTLNSFTMGALGAVVAATTDKTVKQKPMGEETIQLRQERRERLKKAHNPELIFYYYIDKEGMKLGEEEQYLLRTVAKLKDVTGLGNLDVILGRIYRLMNEAVDFNLLRFLSLLIMLAADMCFSFKDYRRAFYFYHQATLCASYSSLHSVKMQALIAMATIASDLRRYQNAIIILKKALQYAWKAKSGQHELLIYDYMGTAYYYLGQVREAEYYHHRFTQGEHEKQHSAIRKMSTQMLTDYQMYLQSLEKDNLTSLFLEYINIPIVGLNSLAPKEQPKRRVYANYEEGQSPRKKKQHKRFVDFEDFPQTEQQLDKLLQDYEFQRQIPNPDIQPLYKPGPPKTGRYSKSIPFEQTQEYHRIMGTQKRHFDLSKVYANSLEKRIEKALSDKLDPEWFSKMKRTIRDNRMQKVGHLHERIRNSHQSYSKYPDERRRSSSLKMDKVRQSINKTVLDMLDPVK